MDSIPKWIYACKWSIHHCRENNINRKNYYPNIRSEIPFERILAHNLRKYRVLYRGKKTIPEINEIFEKAQFARWLKHESPLQTAIDKWTVYCLWAKKYCDENNILYNEYFPYHHTAISEEKLLYKSLLNFRSAILESNTCRKYPEVLQLIKNYGFDKWIDVKIDEEIAYLKWKEYCDWAKNYCIENNILLSEYYPKNNSSYKIENKLYRSLIHYRCAFRGTSSQVVYPRVNQTIIDYGFETWLENIGDPNYRLNYNIQDIKRIARVKGIKGISKINKNTKDEWMQKLQLK
jgi:hypothetical protein